MPDNVSEVEVSLSPAAAPSANALSDFFSKAAQIVGRFGQEGHPPKTSSPPPPPPPLVNPAEPAKADAKDEKNDKSDKRAKPDGKTTKNGDAREAGQGPAADGERKEADRAQGGGAERLVRRVAR